MKHLSILMTIIAVASGICRAATVVTYGDNLTFSENTPCGNIEIDFKRCMANELYTFSSVRLNGKELNHTESDNIGPFLISNRGWAGGNHLNGDRRSAFTESVSLQLDGKPLATDTVAYGNVLTVSVVNRLLDPVDDSIFAIEQVNYKVSGNSIDVTANHDFKNETPQLIDRYYGMQSMFVNENEILAPGSKFNKWTGFTKANTGHELQIKKYEAPEFCTFIEHSDNGYQAAYMTREGLGNRDFVADDDIVYIGNSWTKNYHRVMGMHTVKNGDKTSWHGIYSWFDVPVNDHSRNVDEICPTFDYIGYIDGRPTLFHLGPDGHMSHISY